MRSFLYISYISRGDEKHGNGATGASDSRRGWEGEEVVHGDALFQAQVRVMITLRSEQKK